MQDLAAQPSWVHGGALYPHQLEAANWLRRLWAEGRPALLADGPGLGKTASVVTFLQSLRSAVLLVPVDARLTIGNWLAKLLCCSLTSILFFLFYTLGSCARPCE